MAEHSGSLEFGIAVGLSAVAEYFVFKYMTSEGRFKVSKEEKYKVKRDIEEIIKMKTEEEMVRGIREKLIPDVKDKSIAFLLDSMCSTYEMTREY